MSNLFFCSIHLLVKAFWVLKTPKISSNMSFRKNPFYWNEISLFPPDLILDSVIIFPRANETYLIISFLCNPLLLYEASTMLILVKLKESCTSNFRLLGHKVGRHGWSLFLKPCMINTSFRWFVFNFWSRELFQHSVKNKKAWTRRNCD